MSEVDEVHKAYAKAYDDETLLARWDSDELFAFDMGWHAAGKALKEENLRLRKAIAELHTIHPHQVPEMLNWWNRIFREFPGITKAGKESQI